MNGDPSKAPIAAAQDYFTKQTRRAELAQAAAPTSALGALNLAVQVLNEHETRLALIEARMGAVEARPAIEDRTGTGFFSVLGWCRVNAIARSVASRTSPIMP